MRCRVGLLILLALLAACKAPAVKPPKVVETVVTRYVPVDEELTKPCPVAMPKSKTVAEAVRIARARRAALEKCNAKLEEIRNLAR